MKTLFIVILLGLSLACYPQANTNIVPDSSLEAHLECDDSLYNANPTFMAIANRFIYWRSGTKNTAEAYYLSTCMPSNTPYVGYPNTGMGGFVYPRTGNGFGGIQGTFDPVNQPNYRDYLQIQLLMPLEAGKRYYGGFHVQFNNQAYNKYSTNNLGMLLSDTVADPDSVPWNTVIQEVPQIMNDTTYDLKDTLNWTLVADTFIAQGGEKWLTIGNFRDEAHSIFVLTGYNGNVGSYYYIDDVFLYCVDSACATVPAIGIIESKEKDYVYLYPNPAVNKITIEMSNLPTTKYFIKIVDMLGKTNIEIFTDQKTIEIDVSQLPSGMYYLITNSTIFQKLIIE